MISFELCVVVVPRVVNPESLLINSFAIHSTSLIVFGHSDSNIF
jgi:hypothetical protein